MFLQNHFQLEVDNIGIIFSLYFDDALSEAGPAYQPKGDQPKIMKFEFAPLASSILVEMKSSLFILAFKNH